MVKKMGLVAATLLLAAGLTALTGVTAFEVLAYSPWRPLDSDLDGDITTSVDVEILRAEKYADILSTEISSFDQVELLRALNYMRHVFVI